MKRAVIVGSQGQDGRLLTELLAAKGYAVTGLSRRSTHLPGGGLGPPVDLADPAAVAEFVGQANSTEIYYLAAFHHSSQQARALGVREIWDASLAVNATGAVNFLEALRRHAPAARFFYAGSCLAFGRPAQTPQTEDTCFAPCCVYGISKTAGSHAVRLYREAHGVYAVAGILYNHESHLRPEHFLSRKIVRAAVRIMRGEQSELVLGDLGAQADWGYAGDFVEAFWRTLQAPTPDDYVVATGSLHSALDWVEAAFALAGLDWRRHVRQDASLTSRKRPPLIGDISRIRDRCGFAPTTSFERMVELMFDCEAKLT